MELRSLSFCRKENQHFSQWFFKILIFIQRLLLTVFDHLKLRAVKLEKNMFANNLTLCIRLKLFSLGKKLNFRVSKFPINIPHWKIQFELPIDT